jgi:ribonucleoside-diphosphate reductase alpha chain
MIEFDLFIENILSSCTILKSTNYKIKDKNFIVPKEVKFNNNIITPIWSEQAAYFACNKYARKSETSWKNVCDRAFLYIFSYVYNYIYQNNLDSIKVDRLQYLCQLLYMSNLCQLGLFNSPFWFNSGTSGNPITSACFLYDVQDTMLDILDLYKKIGLTFKEGAGVGVNLTNIREKGAFLSGGGEASGVISFIKPLNEIVGTIEQGGKTRRGALLVLLDAGHKEALEFAKLKGNIEQIGKQNNIPINLLPYQNINMSLILHDKDIYNEELIKESAKSIWECGDPGFFYYDVINKAENNFFDTDITGLNACAEVPFFPQTVCNLASLNVLALDKIKDIINIDDIITSFIFGLNILIDTSNYIFQDTQEQVKKYRPTGLGVTNLTAYLLKNNLFYDSSEGREKVKKLLYRITKKSWEASIEYNEIFEIFPKLSEKEFEKMQNKLRSMYDIKSDTLPANSVVTSIAPAGTISLVMDCETTGIEPYYATQYMKKIIGEDGKEKELTFIFETITNSTFNIEDIKNHCTALFITPEAQIDMVAEAQKNISLGISKTVNLSNNITVEKIEELIKYAYNKGLKTISFYRDGSKLTQVLYSNGYNNNNMKRNRRKLPDERQAITHKFEVNGIEGYLTVGLFDDGTPGEIFINIAKEGSTVSGLMDSFALSTSLALQYGVPLKILIDKFTYSKFEPAGYTNHNKIKYAFSLVDYIFRWLQVKFYPEEGIVSQGVKFKNILYGLICPSCGSPDTLIPSGKCLLCTNCGNSTGCS